MDAEDGYTDVVSVAPANESEGHKLEAVVDQITDVRRQASHGVLADKGYHSEANREMRKAGGIVDFSQNKASRNVPPEASHKRFTVQVANARLQAYRKIDNRRLLEGMGAS